MYTNLERNFTVSLYYLVNIYNSPVKESKFPQFWYRLYVLFIANWKKNPPLIFSLAYSRNALRQSL